MTPLIVTWHAAPFLSAGLIRRFRPSLPEMGSLRISLETPQPMGRLTLKNASGDTVFSLIDGLNSRKKRFRLPVATAEKGFFLQDEKGEIVFTYQLTESQMESLKTGLPAESPPRSDETIQPGQCMSELSPEKLTEKGESSP